MKIRLNGEDFDIDSQATLSDLIALLDLNGQRFAIEVNEEIITRSEHPNYVIQAGDAIEVVQAIGGG